jgi:hypothetical protein
MSKGIYNMSDPSNNSQNNEQILNDIQLLQQMEQQLFNNLETNTNLTVEQQQQIIEKISQLSNMRINLYQTLSGMNNYFQGALESSSGILQSQTAAIGIVENELNQAKHRLDALEIEKNNKIRLVEINDYYSDKYAEHSKLMKIIIMTIIPIVILAILKNKDILPNSIFVTLVVIICFISLYYFWNIYTSIVMRDNMNYQEYNWSFNPNAVSTASSSTTTSSDPWLSSSSSGSNTCVGQECCADGLTWDASLNQCTSTFSDITSGAVSYNTGTSSSAQTATAETFVTRESMINNVLTKKEPNKYKYDYNMAPTIQAPLSKSFTNNAKM